MGLVGASRKSPCPVIIIIIINCTIMCGTVPQWLYLVDSCGTVDLLT